MFKLKRKADGLIERHKAQLVAKGFHKQAKIVKSVKDDAPALSADDALAKSAASAANNAIDNVVLPVEG